MHKIRGSARPPTRFLDMNDEIDLGHLKKKWVKLMQNVPDKSVLSVA